MNALILCAGSARRFFPQDDDEARHPKCLLPLQSGETLLSRLLKQTTSRGYGVVLGTGCGHEQVAQLAHERAGEFPDVHCIYNPDYATTNSIVTLWQMRDFVTDHTLLINGDVVVEDRVFDLFDLTTNAPQLLVKHLAQFDDDTYRVRFDEGFRVLELGKEIAAAPSSFCAAFLGVSRVGDAAAFLREIEALLSSGTKQTWPTTAYRQMLPRLPVCAVPIGDALFFDIDTPDEYDAARAAIESGARVSS